jgi:hypothetical protein
MNTMRDDGGSLICFSVSIWRALTLPSRPDDQNRREVLLPVVRDTAVMVLSSRGAEERRAARGRAPEALAGKAPRS